MARVTPTMEMFMVGAYLQLVEGCSSVAYNVDMPDYKEYWLELVGRNEAGQSIYCVDFAEKFDWYPPDMRPETLVKKLVRRYVQVQEYGAALEYEPDHVHCQLWLPRAPARRVAEALPKVVERLRDAHAIPLEVIEPKEVARRIPLVVERAQKLSFDCDNLFIRALLLAQGRLDYQIGAPMGQEQIEAMYRFSRSLRSVGDMPAFLYDFLTSEEIVHWLEFYSPSFDDLRVTLAEAGPGGGLGELEQALAERGERDETSDYADEENADYTPRRYSARDVAEMTRLVFTHADALRAEAGGGPESCRPIQIEVDFMLPFLSCVQERLDASQIEREILRYGGDRDQMMAHFASDHPDKHPYRGILRVELYEPGGERLPAYPGGKSMEVPIEDPALSGKLHVALSINYVADFTGYFLLVMHRLAASLSI